ncbi:unnamed protein product, partial [Notodromas monacha]
MGENGQDGGGECDSHYCVVLGSAAPSSALVIGTVCAASLGDKCDCYYNNNNNSDDDDEHEDTSSNVDRASQGSSSSSSSSRNTRLFGDCGDNLECRLRDDNRSPGDQKATCQFTDQRLVCGLNGKTYNNICQLQEESVVVAVLEDSSSSSINENVDKNNNKQQQPLLTVAQWGPCEEGKYMFEYWMMIDDEMVLFLSNYPSNHQPPASPAAPSPRSEWASTGMQPWQARPAAGPCPPSRGRRRPHDHCRAAMMRRARETHGARVMSVQPHDGGRYTCVATNKLGEARAESQLGGSTR